MFKSIRDKLGFLIMTTSTQKKVLEALHLHRHVTNMQELVDSQFKSALHSQDEMGEDPLLDELTVRGKILQ